MRRKSRRVRRTRSIRPKALTQALIASRRRYRRRYHRQDWAHPKKAIGGSWINENAKPFVSAESNKLYKETATLARLMEIISNGSENFGSAAKSIDDLKSARRFYKSAAAKDIVMDYLQNHSLVPTQIKAAKQYLKLA